MMARRALSSSFGEPLGAGHSPKASAPSQLSFLGASPEVKLIAGFECGLVHGGRHDLLVSTKHTPPTRMSEHYRIVAEHGMTTVRDGLVPGHSAMERMRVAREAGVEAIWDLSHYHRNLDPVRCGHIAAQAALTVNGSARLWICPVNEPSLYPHLAGISRQKAIDMAISMARVVRDHHPDVGVLVNDPITGVGDRQFESMDAMIAAVDVDLVGVNYYPHTARTSLIKVLLKMWRRYHKPILLSETSWHDGHPTHHRRHPGFNKAAWLCHVLDAVDVARFHGAVVTGVCWYPIVDCPPWHAPRSRSRWSHGLIKSDLSVDPALSAQLLNLSRSQSQCTT